MSKAIALIGLSGCGKTTYAKALSEKLNRPLYDIDHLIEEKMGLSVREIFEQFGEPYFRQQEWTVFLECIQDHTAIIATGGGLVPHAVARGQDKPLNVFFVYLNPSVEEIVRRLENPINRLQRPLLDDSVDLSQKVRLLHVARSKAYLAWADEIIDTF